MSAEVVAAAAGSPLGILALLILVLSGIATTFFRKDSARIRLSVFLVMFAAACAVGLVALRGASPAAGSHMASSDNAAGVSAQLTSTPSATSEQLRQWLYDSAGKPNAAHVLALQHWMANNSDHALANISIEALIDGQPFEDQRARAIHALLVTNSLRCGTQTIKNIPDGQEQAVVSVYNNLWPKPDQVTERQTTDGNWTVSVEWPSCT